MQCWLEDLAIDTGLSNTQHQRNAKSTPVRYCLACHSDCVSTVGILVCLCSLSGWWVQLHKEHFCLTQSNSWDIIPDNYFKLLKLSQFFCPPLNLNLTLWILEFGSVSRKKIAACRNGYFDVTLIYENTAYFCWELNLVHSLWWNSYSCCQIQLFSSFCSL